MKILLINEFISLGGAEEIVKKQKQMLKKKGNEVEVLCFNYGNSSNIPDGYKVIESKFKLNKLIFNPIFYYKITKYITKYNPDRIIIHSMFSSPITQYFSIKNYNAVQIIHDYYAVCPNYLCVRFNTDNNVCQGYKCKKCISECYHHNSKIKLIIKLILTIISEKMRKKYIRMCITPSEKLNEYLNNYGYKSVCINNPMDIYTKLEKKKVDGTIKYIYAGGINPHKGIVEFAQFFDKLSYKKDVLLDIYGPITDYKSGERLKRIINNNNKIKYHGSIDNKELIKKIREAKFLIIPSKWMENYPTIVLEAMANGTVVIGSDRGGIPELLSNNRGFIFRYGDLKEIQETLSKSINITDSEYNKIRYNAYQYINENNNYEAYYEKLCKIIEIGK